MTNKEVLNKKVKQWYIIDAKSKILGRIATTIAHYIKGKHKVNYSPHTDQGDYVIVLNASNIIVTGNKKQQKFYYRHSGYVGGLKKVKFKDMLITHPTRIVRKAVQGMLPKNPLGRSMIKKLKIYAGSHHVHNAQQPKNLNI